MSPVTLGAWLLAGAIPSERVREAAARALGDERLQRALPAHAPPPTTWDVPEPLVLLVKLLLSVGLAVLVILAAVWLARRLRPGGRDDALEDEAAQAAPVAIPIVRAQSLAQAGRYAEAIHALLLETLEALSRASRLAPSLTSREIAARVALPSRARDALGHLVLAVELSRFGGAEPGEADYRLCLARFDDFRSAYQGGA